MLLWKIAEMTRHIVGQAKSHQGETIEGDFAMLKTPCPKCGGIVRETYKNSGVNSAIFPSGKF